jgi:hypothetical protein
MRFILLLLTAWVAAVPALAGPTTAPSTQPVLVPYKLTDTNHILIRVKINGQGPFNFIMDTGAPAMFLRDSAADKLKLKKTARGFTTLDQLEIEGGAKLSKVQCVVETPYQIEGMNAIGASGVDLDGLMGYAILARFRLQIDLSKDRMVWTPINYNPPPLPTRRGASGPASSADEKRLESVGSLLKVIGPLVKQIPPPPQYRGFLGLELAQQNNAVMIEQVLGDSAADKAGLIAGDRLLSIDGKPVISITDAQAMVQHIGKGKTAVIRVARDQAKVQLKLIAGEGL